MGRMFLGGIRAALESEENVSAETPIVDESETLAAAQNEVAETGNEVSEITETLEDAAELGDDLQVYEEKAEAAGENGGMSPETADVLQTAVESAFSRFFGDKGQAFPALESFGATGTRMTATTNALEGIRSKIVEVWKALVAFLKSLVAKIVGYYNSVFGAGEKLKKRAVEIKGRSDLTGKQEKPEIENPALFAKLQVAGAVNVKSDIEVVLAALIANTEIGKSIVSEGEAMKTAFSDPVKNKDKFEIKPINNAVFKTVSDDRFGSAGEGMAWAASAEMMGGEAFVYRRPASAVFKGMEALKAMGKLSFNVSKANPSAKAPAAKKMTALKGADIASVASTVEKIADTAIAYRNTSKELEGLLKELAKDAEKAASEAMKNQETKGEDKEVYNALRGAMGKYSTFLAAQGSKAVQFAVQRGGDALQFCEASIKTYK